MRTIAAQEIKRRGIGAVDDLLEEGPVHVISHNRPRYVVMDEEQYRELLEDQETAYVARVKAALEEVAAGQVRRFETVADLMAAIDEADEEE
jgi:PHD/YefM family antitoxin component YafN of YafNO toxin-antitoxin module